jgi:hypothetical protein
MKTNQYFSARKAASLNRPAARARGKWLAVPSLVMLLTVTACGNGAAVSSSVLANGGTGQSQVPTETRSESTIAMTPCESEKEQMPQSSETFVCTKDTSGQLVWIEASASMAITDQRAADVAAKAAATKAAAAKVAADKAAAKAAAEKAAAKKAAADAAAARVASQRAAEAKAAREAVAAQAAAEQAAQQALVAPAGPAASDCDPNYAGACVPIASDVDCAGGSGNGPAYVQGPVQVVGTDIYRLDGNHDGYGCEG